MIIIGDMAIGITIGMVVIGVGIVGMVLHGDGIAGMDLD
jgi:hypothetical protein